MLIDGLGQTSHPAGEVNDSSFSAFERRGRPLVPAGRLRFRDVDLAFFERRMRFAGALRVRLRDRDRLRLVRLRLVRPMVERVAIAALRLLRVVLFRRLVELPARCLVVARFLVADRDLERRLVLGAAAALGRRVVERRVVRRVVERRVAERRVMERRVAERRVVRRVVERRVAERRVVERRVEERLRPAAVVRRTRERLRLARVLRRRGAPVRGLRTTPGFSSGSAIFSKGSRCLVDNFCQILAPFTAVSTAERCWFMAWAR